MPSSTTFTYTDSSGLGTTGVAATATAAASFFNLSQAPTVVKGPLVPSGWSFSSGIDPNLGTAGTLSILAGNPNNGTASDVTTADPTNGGASPNGDILAYVTLRVQSGVSVGTDVPISVDDGNTLLVPAAGSPNTTGYPNLDPDQNAIVQIASSNTAPVTQLSVDTSGIGLANGGTNYSVPVMVTPSTPGGPGISSANAVILFDPNYINPSSITVTSGDLIPASGWSTSFGINTSGNYGSGVPAVDQDAIILSANVTAGAHIASNSTGSLWVINFTAKSGVSGTTVLNLVPSASGITTHDERQLTARPATRITRLLRRRPLLIRIRWTGRSPSPFLR